MLEIQIWTLPPNNALSHLFCCYGNDISWLLCTMKDMGIFRKGLSKIKYCFCFVHDIVILTADSYDAGATSLRVYAPRCSMLTILQLST